jgi:hypothetical protein
MRALQFAAGDCASGLPKKAFLFLATHGLIFISYPPPLLQ